MATIQAIQRPVTVDDLLSKAHHAADIGDGPHTMAYSQEALCLAVSALARDIAALRRELTARSA